MKKIYIFLALLIVLSFGRYIHRAPKRNFSDFHVLYVTAQRFIRGEDIYTFKKGVSYYKYPPFYAFLISPLAFLNEFQAALLWHFLNWIFLITIFFCWLNILKSKRWVLVALLAFIFSFRFILENLDQGQANISFLAFTSIAFYFYFRKRENYSALFLALSILSKYLSVFFLPFFIFQKKYKLLLKILLFILILYFSPILVLGPARMYHLSGQNINFLFKSSLDNYSITCFPNQSLLASLRRMFSANQWYPTQIYPLSDKSVSLLFILVAFLLLVLAYLLRKDRIISISLIATLVPLLNPNGWKNSFIWLVIPAFVVLNQILERKVSDKLLLIMFVLSFVFTALTSEFCVYSWAKDWFEIHSFVTWGALFLYFALLRLSVLNRGSYS